jgi:hypothetical protein
VAQTLFPVLLPALLSNEASEMKLKEQAQISRERERERERTGAKEKVMMT